jgi:hypothetical protein
VTLNDGGVPETGAETQGLVHGLRRAASRVAHIRHIGKTVAVVAVIGLLGAGYAFGGPPATHAPDSRFSQDLTGKSSQYSNGGSYPGAGAVPMPTAAPSMAAAAPEWEGAGGDVQTVTDGSTGYLPIAVQGSVIIKTGSMSLEVADVDRAVAQAQTAVLGAGGYVSSSNRSGSGDYASATITFRVPAAKWDDTLVALRKIGSKVLSEQTDASDVTMQVVDLNARIDNLQKSEQALQAIMARASSVPDVLAVQNQLSQTQGEIERLTAQRDHISDQAAMSTVMVTMSLPGPTVTVQATQDWTLGDQVDQAAAALVRIGQGLATIAVWAVIVALPVAFGLLFLFGILAVGRRIARRGNRTEAAA